MRLYPWLCRVSKRLWLYRTFLRAHRFRIASTSGPASHSMPAGRLTRDALSMYDARAHSPGHRCRNAALPAEMMPQRRRVLKMWA